MDSEKFDSEFVVERVREGLVNGMRIMAQLGERFQHRTRDGVHTHPVPMGCEICSAILDMRLEVLAGNPVNASAIDIMIAEEAKRLRKSRRVDGGYQAGVERLEQMIRTGGYTLAEMIEESGMSRATVFRFISKLGAVPEEGSGKGRRAAVYAPVSKVEKSTPDSTVEEGEVAQPAKAVGNVD